MGFFPFVKKMQDYKNSSDEHLMSLIQNGEETAFNEIYQRYSGRLLHFMFRMLGQDEAKAQDFLQDVFLKIVSSPEKFDTTKNFKTWVFTVAANLCKNSFRKKDKHFADLSEIQSIDSINDFDLVDQQSFKKELSTKLDQLHPVYKEAFILRYHEGLSLNEIALVANCPLGTVKSRLHSAIRILSKKLIHYQPN